MQFLSDWSNVFHVSLWNYKGNRTNDIIMTVSIHKQTSSQNLNRQFQKLHNISENEFAITSFPFTWKIKENSYKIFCFHIFITTNRYWSIYSSMHTFPVLIHRSSQLSITWLIWDLRNKMKHQNTSRESNACKSSNLCNIKMRKLWSYSIWNHKL